MPPQPQRRARPLRTTPESPVRASYCSTWLFPGIGASLVSVTTGSGRDGNESRSSVNELGWQLERSKPLVHLGLAPQLERAPQELTTFLLAISLDQLLDARKLCRRIGVSRNHSISVWERSTGCCPLLHSADRLQE